MKPTNYQRIPIDPKVSRFRLCIHPSRIQGRGLFTDQAIPSRRKVIEYTGTHISNRKLTNRLREIFHRGGSMPRYIFQLNRFWYIDGEIGGCGAERINHSCNPNLKAYTVGDRIFFFSCRRISAGEELTFDYAALPEAPRKVCRCHSPRCRGTLNLFRTASRRKSRIR